MLQKNQPRGEIQTDKIFFAAIKIRDDKIKKREVMQSGRNTYQFEFMRDFLQHAGIVWGDNDKLTTGSRIKKRLNCLRCSGERLGGGMKAFEINNIMESCSIFRRIMTIL